MARITYITKEDKTILFHLSQSSNTTKVLTEILNIDFKNLAIDSVTEIYSTEEFLGKLKSLINKFLKLRNDENPEYGIERNKLFKEEDLYESVSVLGITMRLFYGNEDGIIRCLAKIYNELSITTNRILIYSSENHSSVINFMNR